MSLEIYDYYCLEDRKTCFKNIFIGQRLFSHKFLSFSFSSLYAVYPNPKGSQMVHLVHCFPFHQMMGVYICVYIYMYIIYILSILLDSVYDNLRFFKDGLTTVFKITIPLSLPWHSLLYFLQLHFQNLIHINFIYLLFVSLHQNLSVRRAGICVVYLTSSTGIHVVRAL